MRSPIQFKKINPENPKVFTFNSGPLRIDLGLKNLTKKAIDSQNIQVSLILEDCLSVEGLEGKVPLTIQLTPH